MSMVNDIQNSSENPQQPNQPPSEKKIALHANKTTKCGLKAIIKHYMPYFRIHADEKYKSMFIKDYITCCSESEDKATLTVVQKECKYGCENQLQIVSNVVELMDDNNEAVVDVIYYMFFPYNGGLGLFKTGTHWYDMEHVTIRFKATNIQELLDGVISSSISKIPYKVLFSIHSKYRWFDWSSFDISITNGKLNVYIAKNSHACYPRPNTYIRYFGMANDVCNQGYINKNIDIIMYDPSNPIFQYKSVVDNDDTKNWNRRELHWGELPLYSSYKNSITCYMFT